MYMEIMYRECVNHLPQKMVWISRTDAHADYAVGVCESSAAKDCMDFENIGAISARGLLNPARGLPGV